MNKSRNHHSQSNTVVDTGKKNKILMKNKSIFFRARAQVIQKAFIDHVYCDRNHVMY